MAHIVRQTTVVRDGFHNAFTDLACWQGNYWVAYRKGAGHVSMDGSVVVAVSADRARFREVAELHVPGDNRDPKLLPIDDQCLALYFPSWTRGAPARELQHYVSYTRDGLSWTEPKPILAPHQWLWRVRLHEGRYYGLVVDLSGSWAERKPHELDLVVSDDLEHWERLARIGDNLGLNESDIHFRDDGEAWLITRTTQEEDENAGSYFACARPPYTEWTLTPMPPIVHAPAMLAHAGELYVAGRSVPARDGVTTFAFDQFHRGWSMAMWRVTRGAIEPVLRIPATGDCSYPGLIHDPEGRVCMSYYSQHAYHMGVVEPPASVAGNNHSHVADVYFAELELS